MHFKQKNCCQKCFIPCPYFKLWFFVVFILIRETYQLFIDLSERPPISGYLAGELPLLESTYSVSFKVKPFSFSFGWRSVIHLSIGNNYGTYGDRTPAVFFDPDGTGSLYIISAINGYTSYKANVITQPLPLNIWSSIRISQFQNNGVSIFAVFVDGINVYSIENKSPQSFQNVKVYVSSPWDLSKDCVIKDIRIFNGNEENCELLTSMSTSKQNDEIHILTSMTTTCLCPVLQTTIYLQQSSPLIFKKFVWIGSVLGDSFVHEVGKYLVIRVGELSVNSYVAFNAIFLNGKTMHGINSVSVKSVSSWINCYEDPVIKYNRKTIVVPTSTPVTSVNKLSITWSYKQPERTFLQTQTLEFVCIPMQKRSQSPCYQREISSGIITFLPVSLMDVISYDLNTALIYGRTQRNNYIEMNLNKKTLVVISSEKCSSINACNLT